MLKIEYMGRAFLAEGIKSNKNGSVEPDGKEIYLIAGKPLRWMDFCAIARIYIRVRKFHSGAKQVARTVFLTS